MSDYRHKKARRTWRWMEGYLRDECELIGDVGGEANNLRNAIVNTMPEPSLMEAAIKFLSSGEGLHKVRVGEKMMTRKQLGDALRTWTRAT